MLTCNIPHCLDAEGPSSHDAVHLCYSSYLNEVVTQAILLTTASEEATKAAITILVYICPRLMGSVSESEGARVSALSAADGGLHRVSLGGSLLLLCGRVDGATSDYFPSVNY